MAANIPVQALNSDYAIEKFAEALASSQAQLSLTDVGLLVTMGTLAFIALWRWVIQPARGKTSYSATGEDVLRAKEANIIITTKDRFQRPVILGVASSVDKIVNLFEEQNKLLKNLYNHQNSKIENLEKKAKQA